MTREAFKNLLDRYTLGECTAEEKKYVDQWYENLSSEEIPVDSNIGEKIWMKVRPDGSAKNNRTIYFKIAASISLIIVAAAWLYLSRSGQDQILLSTNRISTTQLIPEFLGIEIRNDLQIPKRVTLEDGSVITLQPKSSLSLPEKFSIGERIVSLKGEAFFEIRRDTLRPFYVYAREVVTKVLGTSFNIKALDADKKITVAVKTGKVSVSTNPKIKQTRSTEVILTPNQQAVYDRRDIVVTKELVEKPQVILKEPTIFKMKYNETPVTEIFAVMKENYGVEIDFDEEVFRSCVLTTNMSNEGLFERIEVICKAINATYTVEDAVIKIHGQGCQ